MEKYYPYPCKQCGNCCKYVNLVEEIKHLDRGDGICKNLTENNLCKIYSNRPNVCNGQYVYEHRYSNISVEDFHKMVAIFCKEIREHKIEELHKKIQDS